MAMRGFKAQGRALQRASNLIASTPALVLAALAATPAASETLGQPTDKALGLQPSGDELRDTAAFFHNVILLPVITAISLFVLALLIIVAVRFNKKSNPVPARFSHNTPIEIIWTVVPVLILTVIAAFQNVADCLRALEADGDAVAANRQAAATAAETFAIARQQFGLGTVSMVVLLNSEQAALVTEIAKVQAEADRYADTAGLFQALGGGWWNRPELAANPL